MRRREQVFVEGSGGRGLVGSRVCMESIGWVGWFCVCEASGSSVCKWIMFVSGGPCTSLKGVPLADGDR